MFQNNSREGSLLSFYSLSSFSSYCVVLQAVASSSEVTFLSVSGSSIYSPYLGDAESAIRELFRKARLGSPSIVFIDEIDAVVGKRDFGGFNFFFPAIFFFSSLIRFYTLFFD
jgi:AAA+ superfamily predicted ATPase